MIEVIDRVPTYPGRVKLTPVSGQANIFDMERADEPVEPGTPINRALFQSFIDEMNTIRQQVEDKLLEISQRVRVGDLADGTVFGLYENGVLVPFIKLKNDYPDSGRYLVVRKDCVTADVLMNAGEKYYADGRIDLWLNNEYLSTLDAATQSSIPNAGVQADSAYGVAAAYRKVFLLSLYEYQMTTSDIAVMGNHISYFSTTDKRIATLDGTPVNHWTRSSNYPRYIAAYITPTGEHEIGDVYTTIAGIRPAFTLPANFEVSVLAPGT